MQGHRDAEGETCDEVGQVIHYTIVVEEGVSGIVVAGSGIARDLPA